MLITLLRRASTSHLRHVVPYRCEHLQERILRLSCGILRGVFSHQQGNGGLRELYQESDRAHKLN